MTHERLINFDDAHERSRFSMGVLKLRGKWRITFARYRPRRSDAQNRMLWGLLYPQISERISELWGERQSKEDIHGLLTLELIGEPVVDHRTGEIKGRKPGRTHNMSTDAFCEYVEKIIRFAAEELDLQLELPADEWDAIRQPQEATA